MIYTSAGSLRRLRQQSARLREIASWPADKLASPVAGVSGWSAAEHVDHMVEVANAVLRRLLQTEFTPLKALSLLGHAVLVTGFIPRGKVKAPSSVRPVPASASELFAALDELDAVLTQLESAGWAAPKGPCVPHPLLGGMTAAQSLRFVGIHTKHHLAIVKDIERAPRP